MAKADRARNRGDSLPQTKDTHRRPIGEYVCVNVRVDGGLPPWKDR